MDDSNKMERIVSSMDFNAHQGSWFDMWHTHIDWDGTGTDNTGIRRRYMLEAIKTYDIFWSKMEDRKQPYQAWILIDLTDSSEDAIYIHAPDPAGDSPFPFSIGLQQTTPAADDQLAGLFTEKGLSLYMQPDNAELYFFARPGVGVPLS